MHLHPTSYPVPDDFLVFPKCLYEVVVRVCHFLATKLGVGLVKTTACMKSMRTITKTTGSKSFIDYFGKNYKFFGLTKGTSPFGVLYKDIQIITLQKIWK